MLERLARKQLVARRKHGRHFIYAPEIDRATVRQHAVQQLIDSLFDGSPSQLSAFLTGEPQKLAAAAEAPAAPAAVQAEPGDSMAPSMDAVLL